MRQGQQNRRGRGRNRKTHHNPLTRSYESNGPDIKIRGTASHIAEKYMSLARDALSSGDPVLAENYLQHAEHYNRIIMAFREQSLQQSGEAMNGTGRYGEAGETDDFSDDEGDEAEGFAPHIRGQDAQPRFESQPRFEDRSHRHENGRHGNGRHENGRHENGRPGRERYQNRGDRGTYVDRQAEPQPMQPVQQVEAAEQPASEPVQQPRTEAPRRRERFAASNQEQPEFLRRPVRRPRREAAANGASTAEANGVSVKDESTE